jgi:hypothetical protein
MPSSDHNVREYVTVYGCVRTLKAAVVVVTVAIDDTGTIRERHRRCAAIVVQAG